MALSAKTKKTLEVIGWIAFSILAVLGLYKVFSPHIYKSLLKKWADKTLSSDSDKKDFIDAIGKMSNSEIFTTWQFITFYIPETEGPADAKKPVPALLQKKIEAISEKYNIFG